MRIVFEPMEVRKGLRHLRAILVAALGAPTLEHWSFPGASQDDRFPHGRAPQKARRSPLRSGTRGDGQAGHLSFLRERSLIVE